ncbi:MAG TPA: hypothetical protein VJ745_01445, partial [Gaiellaceae bacterium]|nr:hypothetical protein [Gaiellaceae bacterium]
PGASQYWDRFGVRCGGGGAVVAGSGSASARRSAGRLNAPRAALVETGPGKTPRVVNREQVTLVREEWCVVDRWWTDDPVDRRYFEVVLESGRNVCVYRDREQGCWFTQNA